MKKLQKPSLRNKKYKVVNAYAEWSHGTGNGCGF